MKLSGQTAIVSGASRGIGLAIAKALAGEGVRVALLARTTEADPRLRGTIHTAAAEVELAGSEALPLVTDVRSEEQVTAAVERTVEHFGGIDICINNASAIALASSDKLPMKRYDLIQAVNSRATFLLSRTCAPHLEKSQNPHVLTLSPPPTLDPGWYAPHLAYTLSKVGMSLCTLGMSAEYAQRGIAFNSLWPQTFIDTDGVRNLFGTDAGSRQSRSPQIMADAALAILGRDSRTTTGRFFIDEEVLREEGLTDFDAYSHGSQDELTPDLFVGPSDGYQIAGTT